MVQQLNDHEREALRAENDFFIGGARVQFALDRENQGDSSPAARAVRERVVVYRAVDAKSTAAANKRKADDEAARHHGAAS
jgi:hypothetical protein